MEIETLATDAEIPCPQCEGKGKVPGAHVGYGASHYMECPTCKGRPVTVAQVLASGWPPDVLTERHPEVIQKLACAMLIEEDEET